MNIQQIKEILEENKFIQTSNNWAVFEREMQGKIWTAHVGGSSDEELEVILSFLGDERVNWPILFTEDQLVDYMKIYEGWK